MLRASSPVCVLCQKGILFKHSTRISLEPSITTKPPSRWLSQSSAALSALAQKRRPSRMELSRTVATPKLEQKKSGKFVATKLRGTSQGPFAGMNRTVANIRDAPRAPSMAEQRRLSRHTGDKNKGPAKGRTQADDFRALKMQRALAVMPYTKRAAIKKKLLETESFTDFSLLPSVQEAIAGRVLAGMTGIKPTPVQSLAIPALTGSRRGRRVGRNKSEADALSAHSMRSFLLAAETGSGKTLAYLIPTIDALKRREAEERDISEQTRTQSTAVSQEHDLFQLDSLALEEQAASGPGRPRVIILVPSAELVDQVGSVAKSFSHGVKFRATMISSAYSSTIIRNRLFAPGGIDVLISTPQLLASIIKSNPTILSRVTHLVVDEADSLLDRSFEEFTTQIIERAEPSLKQLIMCSATIPRRMDSFLRQNYPDILRLTTPNLHAIPRRVQLGVVDAEKGTYHGNKDLACADTIWTIGRAQQEFYEAGLPEHHATKLFLVFVNEREKTVQLADYLCNKGISAQALHRDLDTRRQKDLLAQFTGTASVADDATAGTSPVPDMGRHRPGRTLDNVRVLVTTDLASRGIDTTAVRHVILYDVPHTSIDFIHRLGRVGRMGKRGRGIVLVGKSDRRDVVREVQDGMFRGKALI